MGQAPVRWTVIFFGLVLNSQIAVAQEALRYEKSTRIAPGDYLLKSRNDKPDDIFDRATLVDVGVDLGIGSDCGRVDFRNTLRSTLGNMLDSKYFGDLGKNIIAASPMLATCYFSPTWCAILKHSQLSANFLSQMRLNQCAIIDKYTDSRVDDFYQERQGCVRKNIASNGGNLEEAMDSCQNVWQSDLSNWAGGSAEKVSTNKLIESSAEWAGFKGDESKKSLDLIKSMVADTVVSKGQVQVDYGTKKANLSPENHLLALSAGVEKKLCGDLLGRVTAQRDRPIERVVSDADLKQLAPDSPQPMLDRQTLEALAVMPEAKRAIACKRLSDAVAMTAFTRDINRSLDILTAASQNPHLPPHRKQEIDEKRRQLKESVELTLELERQRREPLNQVVAQINADGQALRSDYLQEGFTSDRAAISNRQVKASLMDCSDWVMCNGRTP